MIDCGMILGNPMLDFIQSIEILCSAIHVAPNTLSAPSNLVTPKRTFLRGRSMHTNNSTSR